MVADTAVPIASASTSTSILPQSKSSSVLYLDHKNHPSPLTNLYHATASRQLTSPTPPSSITEIESAYCTQCLQFWDAGTAFEDCGGVCQILRDTVSKSDDGDDDDGGVVTVTRVVGCTSCPSCGSVLSVGVQPSYSDATGGGDSEMVCLYSCGYCHWSSRECDITVPLTVQDDMENAIHALRTLLTERLASRSIDTNLFVDDSVKGWEGRITVEDRRKRNEERPGVTTMTTRKRQTSALGAGITGLLAGLEEGGWGIDRMEEDTRRRTHTLHQDLLTGVIPVTDTSQTWNRFTVLDKKDDEEDKTLYTHNFTSIQTTRQNTISSSSAASPLLPVPLHLRARYVRRCCAELARGRPGILVKPKVNPLEGDSSLRFGHGKWWKKESSAIHIVPKIQIQKYDVLDGHHALLLHIKNPTLGMVRLRLHNTDFPRNSISTTTPTSPPSNDQTQTASFPERYEDFAMNSMTIKTTSARVIPPPSSNTTTSTDDGTTIMEAVTLESVEDAFLELGKGHNRDPPAVKRWDGKAVLDEYLDHRQQILEGGGVNKDAPSSSLSSYDRLSLIAQEKDEAWIQYIITEEEKDNHATDDQGHGWDDGDGDGGVANRITVPKKEKRDEGGSFVSTPLVMDIEIGNGSWENSWIQPIKMKKDDKGETEMEEKEAEVVDYASFTILPVWKV